MQAIGAAVDNINALDEKLAPLLVELGHVHGESAMFDARYFKLFKVDLRYKFTPSVMSLMESPGLRYG